MSDIISATANLGYMKTRPEWMDIQKKDSTNDIYLDLS
jgi:hypothetical protein